MNKELKELIYNYLIDECDTEQPSAHDIEVGLGQGLDAYGSPERLQYFLAAWYNRSLLRPLPLYLL